MWASLTLLFSLAAADQLIQVQLLYRHGDRTPIYTYKNDPNKDEFGDLPDGTLTKTGMKQQFLQGKKLNELYIQKHQFIKATYNPNDIHIRSAATHRCIQSAASNLAAFYSQSTYHPDVQGWPSNNWTPMPITTHPSDSDDLLEEGSSSCKRIGILEKRRLKNNNYEKYIADNAAFLMNVTQNAGQNVFTYHAISDLYDTLTVQKAHNLTLPSWVTDAVYKQLHDMFITMGDFEHGVASLNTPEQPEIISLRSGMLLKEFLHNIHKAVHQSDDVFNMYMFSAHDSTISALFYLLRNKQAVLGFNAPQYAAHVSLELWQDANSDNYIKMLYSDDAQTPFRDITSTIQGCGGSDKCKLGDFKDIGAKNIPEDFWDTCDDDSVVQNPRRK